MISSAVLARLTGLALAVSLSGAALAQPPANKKATRSARPAASGKPAAGAKSATAQGKSPTLPPTVVARVGGKDITRDQILDMFAMFNGQPILDQAIQAEIIQQEARRLKVTVTPEEVAKGLKDAKENIVQRQMMTGKPMTFEEIAVQEGFTDELLSWSVRMQLLRKKTFEKAMSDKVGTRDNQIKLAHILFATIPLPSDPNEPAKPLTPEEQKEKAAGAQSKAEAVFADLKSGKLTWEQAVKQSEDRSSALRNGELDFFSRGMLDPELDKAGFAIEKTGDIAGPIKTQFGWHILKLVQRGKDLSPAEKAAYRKQQLDMMMNNPQLLNNWQNELREKAKITVNQEVQLIPGKVVKRTFSKVSKPAATKPAADNGRPQPSKSSQKVETTASGLKYDDMTVGRGPSPKPGQWVKVHYIGTLENGKEFDTSYSRQQPFEFQLGQGMVIKGWDEGLASMKVGGRRRLIIPAALGYGEQGAGGVIPPNATLIFDITLLGVSDTPTMRQ